MSAPFLRHSLFGGFVFLSSCFSVSAARSEQTFYDSPSYLPYCIIIDKADRELYFFECDGMEHLQNLIYKSPIVIGGRNKDYRTGKKRNFETPVGNFQIQAYVKDAKWFPPKWAKEHRVNERGEIIGVGGVFGPMWMPLTSYGTPLDPSFSFNPEGYGGLALHGTRDQRQFLKRFSRQSHGCIRLPDGALSFLESFFKKYLVLSSPEQIPKGEKVVFSRGAIPVSIRHSFSLERVLSSATP